jgi:hypothetical protein
VEAVRSKRTENEILRLEQSDWLYLQFRPHLGLKENKTLCNSTKQGNFPTAYASSSHSF